MVQVNIVGGCSARVEADGLAYNKGDCLGFSFAYRLGGGGSALGFVEHFVRKLMNKGAELFGGCLSGKNGDLAAVAHAKRGSDAVLELQLNALTRGEVDEPFAVRSNLPLHALGELRKLCAFGL